MSFSKTLVVALALCAFAPAARATTVDVNIDVATIDTTRIDFPTSSIYASGFGSFGALSPITLGTAYTQPALSLTAGDIVNIHVNLPSPIVVHIPGALSAGYNFEAEWGVADQFPLPGNSMAVTATLGAGSSPFVGQYTSGSISTLVHLSAGGSFAFAPGPDADMTITDFDVTFTAASSGVFQARYFGLMVVGAGELPATPAEVPEPGTVALLALGAAAALRRRAP